MQQDNNNIENKLRQLESQQLPDLSNMDEHWNKMQTMLQSPAPKSTLRINNKGKLIGGAIGIAVIVLCFLAYQKFGADETEQQKQIVTSVVPNTIITKDEPTANVISSSGVVVKDSAAIPDNQKQFVLFKNTTAVIQPSANISNGNTVPNFVDRLDTNSKTSQNKIDRTPLLNELKNQLTKDPQQFVINNTRDTLITALEGTSILIPANSLGSSTEVEVMLTEYYKRSDIIENQLSTTSNGDQLVTSGMLHITATYKGKEVKVNNNIPLTLFMPDTSGINMTGMELFNGDKTDKSVNWIPQVQKFSKTQLVTEVRVLNITDQPYMTKQTSKGEIGYFITGDSLKMTKAELKKILKQNYGYYKVKLRSNIKNLFKSENGNRAFEHEYGENIGDSMWVEKEYADKYKLQGTDTRKTIRKLTSTGLWDNGVLNAIQNKLNGGLVLPDNDQSSLILKSIQEKYHLNITQLGWLNCVRFYNDSRKKISYATDLGDAAENYYTMLVFDNINSMIAGEYDGNRVVFKNIPVGEPVKIISIGVNKEGEKVYAVTPAVTSEQEVKGLKYELAAAIDIKQSLGKLDQ